MRVTGSNCATICDRQAAPEAAGCADAGGSRAADGGGTGAEVPRGVRRRLRAGLRVFDVTNLKVSDIDSKRMILHVEQGKGMKDRNAMLSPRLLELLREWWLIERPTT
jgi:integrase